MRPELIWKNCCLSALFIMIVKYCFDTLFTWPAWNYLVKYYNRSFRITTRSFPVVFVLSAVFSIGVPFAVTMLRLVEKRNALQAELEELDGECSAGMTEH